MPQGDKGSSGRGPTVIGLTGTPGTGKKTIAPLLARRLKVTAVSIDELASPRGLVRAGELDTKAMSRVISGLIHVRCVLYGHLLADVLPPAAAERVVVLRCDPAKLKLRLEERGYTRNKVMANVEAELIGLVASSAIQAFGPKKSFEFDTTNGDPGDHATEIARSLTKKGSLRIDWLEKYSSPNRLSRLLGA